MYEMMPSNITRPVLPRPLPVGEDVIARMPEFVVLGGVDEAEPPVDHAGGDAGHVCGRGDVAHVVGGEAVAGFEGEVGVLEKEFGFT